MRRGILLIGLFLLLVNTLFVSASYSVGNQSHNIQKTYGPGADIQGWINLSIINENIGEIVKDSSNKEISILDLLRSDSLLVEDKDYFCNPVGCGSIFTASNGETSKTFTLNENQKKVLGFRFDGLIDDIDSTEFNIVSDASSDCSNQLEIDLFADGTIDLGNSKTGDTFCITSDKYGCYNQSKWNSDYNFIPGGGDMYCQRIKLSASPGFKIGAWLKIQADAETTVMAIYDLILNEQLAQCELDDTPTEGEVFCEVELLVTEPQDYYVCIYNEEGIDTKTQIKSYVDSQNGCGFYTSSSYPETENSAYYIFVEGRNFDAFGTQTINDDGPVDDISNEIMTYIYDNYDGADCPSSGCIVPLIIKSNKDQTVILEDISIVYTSNLGAKSISKVNDLELSSASISTNGSQKISLDGAGFVAPTKIGSSFYKVFFSGDEIFRENISVQQVPQIKSVTPMSAFTLFPINFVVSVEKVNNSTIDEYFWQFGSSAAVRTNTNRLEGKIFNAIGSVPLKVTVTDVNGRTGSKTFNIEVGDFQSLFLQKLNQAKANILNVSNKMKTFPLFYQNGIKPVLDPDEITRKLTAIEEAYGNASTENQYAKVVNDFLSLDVPNLIFEKINSDYISFYANKNSINLNVVTEFLGGTYESRDEQEYVSAASDWSILNVDSRIKYKRIDVNYEGSSEPVLNIFELKVKQIGDMQSPGYIFIRQLENIQFDKSYGETVKLGYIEIPIGSGEQTITFLTTEEVDPISVPIFFSPSIDSLQILNLTEEDVQPFKWALFVVIIIFLILFGLVLYIILQNWYKTRYETYLFKNRNYLFNLIHYIDTQKKKGVKDSEIFSKLKREGWNSEQIDYVMKKYLGKRTGMLELPVERVLKWFKKQPTPTGNGNIPPKPGMLPPRMPMRRPPVGRGPIGNNRFPRK